MKFVATTIAFAAAASAVPIERATQRINLGGPADDLIPALDQSVIQNVNARNLGWKAGVNSKVRMSLIYKLVKYRFFLVKYRFFHC
jgi:hypothetical protein